MTRRSSRNVAFNVLGQGGQLVLSLVALRLVYAQLGEDAVGVIYFALTLNAVVGALLEMGIGATTTREVAAHTSREPGYIRDLVRTASSFYWMAYLLLALTSVWAAPHLVSDWLELGDLDSAVATSALQILAPGALLGLQRALYVSLFRGLQRMEYNNLIDVTVAGCQQLAVIVTILLGGGLLDAVSCLAAGYALGLAAYVVAASRFLPWSSFLPGISSDVVRRNWQFARSMTSISLLAMVQTQSDKVVVSRLLPLGALGPYSVLYGLLARSGILTGAISQAVFPLLSEQYAAGARRELLSSYWKSQDLVCYATVPVFAAITYSVVPLFTFVFDANVAQGLPRVAAVLAAGFFLNSALTIPYMLSLAVGKPGIMARTNLLALFVVVPATVLLVYSWGLIGAAMSWVVYHVFAYAVALPRICRECLGMPVGDWFRHFLRVSLLATLTYGTAWCALMASESHSVVALTMAYTAASAAYFALGRRWLAPETAQAIRSRLAAIVERLR